MKVSQMTQSTTPSADDVLMMLEGGTANKKITFGQVGDWVNKEHTVSNLETNTKTVAGAINEIGTEVTEVGDAVAELKNDLDDLSLIVTGESTEEDTVYSGDITVGQNGTIQKTKRFFELATPVPAGKKYSVVCKINNAGSTLKYSFYEIDASGSDITSHRLTFGTEEEFTTAGTVAAFGVYVNALTQGDVVTLIVTILADEPQGDSLIESVDTLKSTTATNTSNIASLANEQETIKEEIYGEVVYNYIENKALDASGAEIDDVESAVSEYIPYTWTGATIYHYGEGSNKYRIAFYDANKSLLGSFQSLSDTPYRNVNAENSVTGTVAYVRFSFKKGFAAYAVKNSASDPVVYWAASESNNGGILSDIEELQDRPNGEVETVFTDWYEGGYRETGVIYFPNGNYIIRTDYIPVYDKLTISVDAGYQVRVSLFDIAGTLLSRAEFTSTDTVVTSDAAAFVRLELIDAQHSDLSYDPNTVGLHVHMIRTGRASLINTVISARANDPNYDMTQVLPKYLALVACREKHESGKIDKTVGYLYRTVTPPYKFYYASGNPENAQFLFDWNQALATSNTNEQRSTPIHYSYVMTDEGDVICVYRGEIVSQFPRANPIVYPHSDYTSPVLVELDGTKPTSWISNSGVFAESGSVWFGEYIRDWHTHAYVWQVSAPYTQAENWTIRKTYERDTDISDPSTMVPGRIEHIHHVTRDPFSGVLYVTTGDHWTEARIDYLMDDTWGTLLAGDETLCRQLNFVFTPTYIYWASDAHAIWNPDTQAYDTGAHKFFRAKRDINGLIDIANVNVYQLYDASSVTVTYHVAYVPNPECILIFDRRDGGADCAEVLFRIWNIKEERIEYTGTVKQIKDTNATLCIGFRCECCQHYPNPADKRYVVGYSYNPNPIDACGNPLPLGGSQTTNDENNKTNVNSIMISVDRN